MVPLRYFFSWSKIAKFGPKKNPCEIYIWQYKNRQNKIKIENKMILLLIGLGYAKTLEINDYFWNLYPNQVRNFR